MINQSLSDLCEFIVDCEHKTAPLSKDGYPSIRTPNVGKGRLILDGVNRVSEETYRAWTKRAVPQADDLIIAREAPVGNVAIIPPSLKVCLGQRTVLVRPNKSKVDPRYLCYFLLGDYAQGRFRATSSGATVAHLNMKDIRNLSMPQLPSMATQRRIAEILGAYDDLIEVNRRRLAVLDEMARGLFEEWFVHFRFPGHEVISFEETPKGNIPKGWVISTLNEHVNASYGFTESSTLQPIGPKFLRVMDINKQPYVEWDSVPYAPFEGPRSRFALLLGDLVVGRMADVGKVGLIDKDIDAIAASYLVRMRPKISSQSLFFYFLTSHRAYLNYVTGASTGTTRKSAGIPVLTGYQFVMPDKDILQQFVDMVRPMRQLGTTLTETNAKLGASRDLLLPRLISGQLSVEAAERELEAA